MTCHRCRRSFTAEHSWLRVERGVTLGDGTTVAADRNYCSAACWAADHTAPDPETTAP